MSCSTFFSNSSLSPMRSYPHFIHISVVLYTFRLHTICLDQTSFIQNFHFNNKRTRYIRRRGDVRCKKHKMEREKGER